MSKDAQGIKVLVMECMALPKRLKFPSLEMTMAMSLTTGVILAACTSGTDTIDDPTESVTTEFDGTWRSGCFENTIFMVPEEDQPGGYVQTTLTVDSSTSIFSTRTTIYTDSECMIEDPDETPAVRTGSIQFDGLVTTNSGLEATVVRYDSDGSSPDLIGLLYRDGDILYREARESTLIEDIVPVELSLSNPWQLVR